MCNGKTRIGLVRERRNTYQPMSLYCNFAGYSEAINRGACGPDLTRALFHRNQLHFIFERGYGTTENVQNVSCVDRVENASTSRSSLTGH